MIRNADEGNLTSLVYDHAVAIYSLRNHITAPRNMKKVDFYPYPSPDEDTFGSIYKVSS